MPSYLLALYDDPASFADFTPEEMQACIAEYTAWATSLEERGLLVASDKLHDGSGRVMRKNGGPEGGQVRVIDGPYSETNEVLGGFFVVRADDYDGAVALARECPHLTYGGTIEIREIEEH